MAVRYANERVVWDRPIGAYQALAHPLAQARADIEAARLVNARAAWLFDQGRSCGVDANMAKLLGAQAGIRACDQAIQTMGGKGYAREYHVERLYRDVRLARIAPGSEEILLNFIAQRVLGLPRSY